MPKHNKRDKILLGAELKIVQVWYYQKGEHFVWYKDNLFIFSCYKANTRVNELVRAGLMQKVAQDRFAHYAITELWELYLSAIKKWKQMKYVCWDFVIVRRDGSYKRISKPTNVK